MMTDSMALDEVTDRWNVDDAQQWSQDGSLGHAWAACYSLWAVAAKFDELRAVGQIWLQPARCYSFDAELREDLRQSLVEHLDEVEVDLILLDIENKIPRWDIWVEPRENSAI